MVGWEQEPEHADGDEEEEGDEEEPEPKTFIVSPTAVFQDFGFHDGRVKVVRGEGYRGFVYMNCDVGAFRSWFVLAGLLLLSRFIL